MHHNTLHAFEDLPFEQAVLLGAETFHCQPYWPEERYRSELATGRIFPEDLADVLIDDLGDDADELIGSQGTRYHLRMAMLEHPLRTGPVHELRWAVEETDALRRFRDETPPADRIAMIKDTRHWVMRDLRNGRDRDAMSESGRRVRTLVDSITKLFRAPNIEAWDDSTWEAFTLHMLWLLCRDGVSQVERPLRQQSRSPRHRDWLLEATGEDTDRLVADLLIRHCAAFLDQGFADWALPDRSAGLYRSFIETYRHAGGPPDRWLRGLESELTRLHDNDVAPLDSIRESLEILGVDDRDQEQFITQTLLALRGFAGMIWQMETRGDRVEHPAPRGSLTEFLAVRLILDRFAVTSVGRRSLGFHGPLCGTACGDSATRRTTTSGRRRTACLAGVSARSGARVETAQPAFPVEIGLDAARERN